MILTGSYYTKDLVNTWYFNDGLPFAKKIIEVFPNLNNIFKSFSIYKNKVDNIILNLCLPYYDKMSLENFKRLQMIENALKNLNYNSMNAKKKNYLISELTSYNGYSDVAIYNELLLFEELNERFNKDVVELYPEISDNRHSDIYLRIDDAEIYIEIGVLTESLPTKKIKKVLNESSEYLGKKIKNKYIKLEINSYNFEFNEKGHFDDKKTLKKIKKEIEKLHIETIPNLKTYLDINDLLYYIKNEEIFEPLIGNLNFIPFFNELLLDQEFKIWLDKNKKDFGTEIDLITTIHSTKLDHEYVTVHTEYMFPSQAANLIHTSYVNHILRHLDDQIHQLKQGSKNLIVIQADYLNMFVMANKYIVENTLFNRLFDYMRDKKIEHLSGIAIFNHNFSEAIYLPNICASQASELTKEILKKIGINVFINDNS